MTDTIGHFSLWGDFEPDEVTAVLNLQPSRVYPKGTVFEGGAFPAKVTTWDLYCPEDLSMKEQVEHLIEKLLPHTDVLRPLAERYTADFNISGEATEVMQLSAGMLQKLVQLNVNLNCFFTERVIHAN